MASNVTKREFIESVARKDVSVDCTAKSGALIWQSFIDKAVITAEGYLCGANTTIKIPWDRATIQKEDDGSGYKIILDDVTISVLFSWD